MLTLLSQILIDKNTLRRSTERGPSLINPKSTAHTIECLYLPLIRGDGSAVVTLTVVIVLVVSAIVVVSGRAEVASNIEQIVLLLVCDT